MCRLVVSMNKFYRCNRHQNPRFLFFTHVLCDGVCSNNVNKSVKKTSILWSTFRTIWNRRELNTFNSVNCTNLSFFIKRFFLCKLFKLFNFNFKILWMLLIKYFYIKFLFCKQKQRAKFCQIKFLALFM